MDFGEDYEEEEHFREICASFHLYHEDALREIQRRVRALRVAFPPAPAPSAAGVPEHSRYAVRPRVEEREEIWRGCASRNQSVLSRMIESQYEKHVLPYTPRAPRVSLNHREKLRSTLRQIAREWSEEGKNERDESFLPILEALRTYLPSSNQRVCVPGVGLGRLMVEIGALGHHATGIEFTYQMLLASDWILYQLNEINSEVVHPFMDQPSNVKKFQDSVRAVRFPDVVPWDLLRGNKEEPLGSIRMLAGEFTRVCAQDVEVWDAVVACFFLDTASNLLEYLECVFRMLRPGGVLVSLGPLLYHFQPPHGGPEREEEDARFRDSVEFTMEDVLGLVEQAGFRVRRSEMRERVRYTSNPLSMMQTSFDALFLVAQKPDET